MSTIRRVYGWVKITVRIYVLLLDGEQYENNECRNKNNPYSLRLNFNFTLLKHQIPTHNPLPDVLDFLDDSLEV